MWFDCSLCKVFHIYLQVKKKICHKATESEHWFCQPEPMPNWCFVLCIGQVSAASFFFLLFAQSGFGTSGRSRTNNTPLLLSLLLSCLCLSSRSISLAVASSGCFGDWKMWKEGIIGPCHLACSMSIHRRRSTWGHCWPWSYIVHR